jgi:hypothetical protein
MRRRLQWLGCLGAVLLPALAAAGESGALVPPLAQIKTDRPRLLVRPKATPLAVTLDQLAAIPRDAEFGQMLARLRATKDAAAQAMVYLLTGDAKAADQAIGILRGMKPAARPDSFGVYFTLREAALAYDWLATYPGFTPAIKAEVRARMSPVAAHGAAGGNDHVFHNYVWMNCGGAMLWALAAAGDDPETDRIFNTMRGRLNNGMYPGMRYLNGQPGESPGYWTLYDLSPCALTVLATQSAFESDLIGAIRTEQGDWLKRQLLTVIQETLPNMRYITWGDIQSGGDGGVTHEVIGVMDGLTWATQCPEGVFFSQWLAKKRGLPRFYEFHGIFYFLYTRNLSVKPVAPPPAFLTGGETGGAFIARSGWTDGDTVVALRSTDYFGNHNHYDAGSFFIYRNGHLVADPDLYKSVGGAQQKTDVHSTLLIGGKGQRGLRAQNSRTVQDFVRNLTAGARLETGDIPFTATGPGWAAATARFGQAYAPDQVAECVRQVLFIRPGTIIVVDRLTAPAGKTLGEVQWQLMLAAEPKTGPTPAAFWITNGKSWLTCRSLLDQKPREETAPSIQKTFRWCETYQGGAELLLAHVLEVGDGTQPAAPADVTAKTTPAGLEITGRGSTYTFTEEKVSGTFSEKGS